MSKPWLDRLLEGAPRQTLKAVIDVSFDIDARETLALVGESGVGEIDFGKDGRRPFAADSR